MNPQIFLYHNPICFHHFNYIHHKYFVISPLALTLKRTNELDFLGIYLHDYENCIYLLHSNKLLHVSCNLLTLL